MIKKRETGSRTIVVGIMEIGGYVLATASKKVHLDIHSVKGIYSPFM